MAELTHLFSPITIRDLTIRNRIFSSAHVTAFGEKGLPTDRHVRYYEARAKGGVGLIIQEGTVVSPHAQFHEKAFVQGWKDEIRPWLKKIVETVHAHGTKMFLQLWHGGSYSCSHYTSRPGVSSSDIPMKFIGEVPLVLDEEMIREEVQAFVGLALKGKEAGYDGVELNFAHGYLHQQFMSPATNIRKDAYGGSLENRMRFGMMVIAEVREALGEDMVIGVRASADELIPEGYTLEDMKQVMSIWEGTGLLDYLNVTITGVLAVSPMMVPPRPFVYCAAEIKQIVDLPVFSAIRINDPVTANDIIKNNEADMVAMTRATLCDPELPNKAREGRLDDIRLCIACNQGCWGNWERRESITCTQNPEAGREGEFRITPAANRKKVMVIGGGCAGMEAAVVAKQRGHEVTLYEKTGQLGGAILIPARVPSRQELGQAVRYLKHEVERLGIPVYLNTEVTADRVLREGPDAVILATGGTAVSDPRPDVVGPCSAVRIEPGSHVVTAEDVLEGKVETGARVVIADQQNYMKGLVTAEFLADQGKDVTLVMPVPARLTTPNSYDVDLITLTVQKMNIKTKGVKCIHDNEVKGVRPGRVVLREAYTEQLQEIEADTLVLSYWRRTDTTLYDRLKGKVKAIYRIGDALAPRRLINAIYDGYKVAAEI
jgi:2,4-dienoyl-CoA reductase-like NADH-dependent reductase (Old Yellow Enzyme family)/thioredoxin reductase